MPGPCWPLPDGILSGFRIHDAMHYHSFLETRGYRMRRRGRAFWRRCGMYLPLFAGFSVAAKRSYARWECGYRSPATCGTWRARSPALTLAVRRVPILI